MRAPCIFDEGPGVLRVLNIHEATQSYMREHFMY